MPDRVVEKEHADCRWKRIYFAGKNLILEYALSVSDRHKETVIFHCLRRANPFLKILLIPCKIKESKDRSEERRVGKECG